MLGHIYSLIDLFFDSIFPSLKEKNANFMQTSCISTYMLTTLYIKELLLLWFNEKKAFVEKA